MPSFTCPFCDKVCKTEWGLKQHIESSALCKYRLDQCQEIEDGEKKRPQQGKTTIADSDDDTDSEGLTMDRSQWKTYQGWVDEDALARGKLGLGLPKEATNMEKDGTQMEIESVQLLDDDGDTDDEFAVEHVPFADEDGTSGEENGAPGEEYFDLLAEATDEEILSETESETGSGEAEEEDNEGEQEDVEGEEEEEDGSSLEELGTGGSVQVEELFHRSKKSNVQFKAFTRYACQHFAELDKNEVAAIKIMHTLQKKKATLDTYEAVMDWHLRQRGILNDRQSLGDTKLFISRYKLMKKLRKRYHLDKFPMQIEKIVLPHTQTKVSVPWQHARDCTRSLLTDPRWKDEDWLFFDDDPFAPPPEDLDYVADLNTGEAFLQTYRKLITKPTKQVLCGIALYIDGAVTGQFDKLQVEALKMTLCILNRRARDKEYAWRTLGLVPNYTKEDSRGKRIFIESGHVAAHELYMDMSDEEGMAENNDDADKAADYHAILDVLLRSVRELIEEGMVVDLVYKGKLHKNVELVFFIPFVKCDGDEGDKLCLHYRSRGKDIKQLCRYCQCPNADTDNPHASHPFKTEPLLKGMYDNKNVEGLKEMSQICAKNAFHGLRFGLHNNRGIHGACPWELLHAILLGIFKYARDCFFLQMGKTSVTANEVNALAKVLGTLMARQSDRKKPRTKFAQGIWKGKLMAKEYTGVLLIMSAILACKAGQDLLRTAYKRNFRENWQRQDWCLLVDTLLQWEAYLMSDRMERKHVQRLKRKNRFVMFLLKKIGNRTEGMGFKVMKFHAIVHLAFDILMFGVPTVVDTGSNESHHKTTKVAAKLTQKDVHNFEIQTLKRLNDFHALDLAMEEIDGRPLWHYLLGYVHEEIEQVEEITRTGGMIMNVFRDEDSNEVAFKIITRMQNKEAVEMDVDLLDFLFLVQECVVDDVPVMPICSEHKRQGVMFRAHPNYRGKGPWRDWAIIRWEEGDFPAKIWCFLDLQEMDGGVEIVIDDENIVEQGVFAVVESAKVVDEDAVSDIWKPIQMEVKAEDNNGEMTVRQFYVVNVDTIVDPICVIPDIGAKPKHRFLQMQPRAEWANDFISWLEMPHQQDVMEMQEPDEEEEESE